MSLLATFHVDGEPITKGSMRAVTDKRTRKIRMLHDQGADLKAWTDAIRVEAKQHYRAKPTPCAVAMALEFRLSRPKCHFGTGKNAQTLKERAPRLPTVTGRDDLDKLIRTVLDALTGILYRDDSQVTTVAATKRYAAQPGLSVEVREDWGLGWPMTSNARSKGD